MSISPTREHQIRRAAAAEKAVDRQGWASVGRQLFSNQLLQSEHPFLHAGTWTAYVWMCDVQHGFKLTWVDTRERSQVWTLGLHVYTGLYEFVRRARKLYPCLGFQFGMKCSLYEAFCVDLQHVHADLYTTLRVSTAFEIVPDGWHAKIISTCP